jgi:chemotaxis protein methyltransferase CheR
VREFGFEPQDHRAIATMVYDELGILLPEGKASPRSATMLS